MSKLMKKIDAKNITTQIIADSLMIFECEDEGKPHPTIRECDSYKQLVAYFQSAHYSIQTCGDKSHLIIKHNKYSRQKFTHNNNTVKFNTTSVNYNNDTLEAKIILDKDMPILDKEIKILAARKNNENNYDCVLIIFNGEMVYNKIR